MFDTEKTVALAAAGDRDAFELLVDRYQGPVCAMAYSIVGDVSQSEDVAQEAFIAAWKGLPNLRSTSRFQGWLFAITKNIARSGLRKRSRDVLNGAAPVEEEDAITQPELPDTSDAVWAALEELPETYRVPLVMFYREGESTAAVAEALGITEECARQRLARGRKMLKDQVAHLVQDILENTRPNTGFTAAVMASLTLGASSSAMAQASATVAAAKGAAVAGQSAGAVALVTMLGPILGMTGGFFGMRASIRNAQTLAIRRFTLRAGSAFYAFLWVFLGFQGTAGALLWEDMTRTLTVSGVAWAIYGPLLFVLIALWNKRQWRLANAEVGKEDPRILEEENVARCWRWFGVSIVLAVVGSVGTIVWLHSLPGVPWGIGAFFLILSHVIFAALTIDGIRTSKDEVAFEATAPQQTADAFVISVATTTKPNEKTLLWNDALAMAGSIFGSQAWIVVSAINAGLFAWAAAIAISGIAIVVTATRYRKKHPESRMGTMATAISLAGVASALFLSMNWTRSIDVAEHMPVWSNYIAAGAALGLHLAIAFSLIVMGKTNAAMGFNGASDGADSE